MKSNRIVTKLVVLWWLVQTTSLVRAQGPSWSWLSDNVDSVATVLEITSPHFPIHRSGLATSDNLSLIANVKTICPLPFDGFDAKRIIQDLPSLKTLGEDLESDKSLRQQRNEAAEELTSKGFVVVDCLTTASTPDAELLFAKTRGGFRNDGNDLPTYFWILFANGEHLRVVHGERELLGLARPVSGWLPLSISALVDQIRAVVGAASGMAANGRTMSPDVAVPKTQGKLSRSAKARRTFAEKVNQRNGDNIFTADGPDMTFLVVRMPNVTRDDCSSLYASTQENLRAEGFTHVVCIADQNTAFTFDLGSQY
jgi:hypothetical protein